VNQLLVAIFPDEANAYEAARTLEDPSDPAYIALRGVAVIAKHADGTISEKKWTSRVAFRAPIGALVGALIGLPAGLLGSAIGFTAGGLLGFSRDLANFGIEESFFNDVAAQLTPGKGALVLEVAKNESASLEARLRKLGAAAVMRTDLKSQGKPSDAP
jgi:uncharacterized membrane protein